MAKKRIYETDAVKAFAARMSGASLRKYFIARELLSTQGYLSYPQAERLDGYDNLFAIRIVTRGNERFFYCYDAGDMIAIIHAFEKRTEKTPLAEIRQALKIRKTMFGGVA